VTIIVRFVLIVLLEVIPFVELFTGDIIKVVVHIQSIPHPSEDVKRNLKIVSLDNRRSTPYTIGMNKKFSPELHDEFDVFGREIVKKFLAKTMKLEARDNPDQYGIDLVLYKNDTIVGYAEVEVRTNWNALNFPFDDLNVPLRKGKLFNNDLPSLFFSVNQPGTALMYCSSDLVMRSRIENSPNKYMREEMFFKVPVEKMKFVIL
jgi:hypothetical protein